MLDQKQRYRRRLFQRHVALVESSRPSLLLLHLDGVSIGIRVFEYLSQAYFYIVHLRGLAVIKLVQCNFSAISEIALGGRIFRWVLSYLTGRAIYTTTEDGNTTHYQVSRGVPQGGVSSSTLFNITLLAWYGGRASEYVQCIHLCRRCLHLCVRKNKSTTSHQTPKSSDAICIYLNWCGLVVSADKSAMLSFARHSMNKYPLLFFRQPSIIVSKPMFLGVVVD